MRIHFPNHDSKAPRIHAQQALDECKQNGTVARHVRFKTLETKQRRGTGSALEVQLEATQRDRGRRAGNSGSYGAMRAEYDGYTATYDEWGFFLAALYRLAGDELIVGTPKFPVYADAEHFHHRTGRTYDADYPAELEAWEEIEDEEHHDYGRIDDYRYRSGRNQIGRRGAGRVHIENNGTRWAKLDPRTPEFLRQLHAGEMF